MTTTNDISSEQLQGLLAAIALVNQDRQRLAVPRSLEIENVQFHLRPSGELVIEQSNDGGVVTLSPSDTFALLTFMRVPGVAEVIEQAEAADEAELWRGFVASEAAERAAGR